MRICYSIADQTFQHSKSIGILNVSFGLLPALASQPAVEKIVLLANSSTPPIEGSNAKIERILCDSAIRSKGSRMWWDQVKLYEIAKNSGCDWLFLPKGFLPFVGRPPIKVAAYVHDALRDFCRVHYPNTFSRFEYWYFDQGLKAALRHASQIFTNSEFTRQEITAKGRAMGIKLPPISLAGIGFKAAVPASQSKTDQVMVLINRWEYKLARQTVEFVARWQKDSAYPGLIHWVGDLPGDVTLPTLPNARHSYRVPEQEYFQTMAASRVLVYASAYEGFGMPPVEAILQGTAPVYSHIPAMAESARGGGFPFQNQDFASFFRAMQQALVCPPSRIEEWAGSLVQYHSWEAVAQRVVEALATR